MEGNIILKKLDTHKAILEKYDAKLNKLETTLDKHSEQLNQHSEILNQHSEILNQHSEILNQHSEQLNQHSEILNQHSEQLNQHTEQLDFIAQTVFTHNLRLDELFNKVDQLPTKFEWNNFVNKLDSLIGIVTTLDQERILTRHAFSRIEEKVDQNTFDIRLIKPLVNMTV